MQVKRGDFVKYTYLHRTGICRITLVLGDTVFFRDVNTGEELKFSKDFVEFVESPVPDPKKNMVYEIADVNIPEDDLEIAQVLFTHKDGCVDPNEYVLNIIYSVSYESHQGDPNCWSSDWDCLGYTECEAEVIDLQVFHHDRSQDTDHLVGIGKQVDEINIDEVMTRETWSSIRNSVESNYCDHMEAIAEEGYNE